MLSGRLARLALGISLLCASVLRATAGIQPHVVTAIFENDLLADPTGPHQDRHYTQGLKVFYFNGDHCLTNAAAWLSNALPLIALRDPQNDLGIVTLGQNIYTPQELTLPHPDPRDRPYAGWLYTGLALQRRGVTGATPVQENFELDFGVVGPDSLADASQKTTHHWRNFLIPQGWDDQLRNEPALLLRYKRTWRLSFSENAARFVDVLPHIGANLGNVNVSGNLGIVGRVGYQLPEDFGQPLIDSVAATSGEPRPDAPPVGFYVFGGAEGRIVGHNIFLDGSTFHGGPSVEKNLLTADVVWGLTLEITRYFTTSYTRIIRTKEFNSQQGEDVFGSLSAELHFRF